MARLCTAPSGDSFAEVTRHAPSSGCCDVIRPRTCQESMGKPLYMSHLQIIPDLWLMEGCGWGSRWCGAEWVSLGDPHDISRFGMVVAQALGMRL